MVSYCSHGTALLPQSCLNPCCSGRWSRTLAKHLTNTFASVLILVVVEDGLVPWVVRINPKVAKVLILVVVEDGLVLWQLLKVKLQDSSLNPCCSGRWSRTLLGLEKMVKADCLNPCCSGRWSRT